MTRTVIIIIKVHIHRHSLEPSRNIVQDDIARHQFGLLDELAKAIAIVLAAKDSRRAVTNQHLSSCIALEFESSDFLACSCTPATDHCHALKLVLAIMLHQSTRRIGFVNQMACSAFDWFSDSSIRQSLLQSWFRRRASFPYDGSFRVLDSDIGVDEVFGVLFILWSDRLSLVRGRERRPLRWLRRSLVRAWQHRSAKIRGGSAWCHSIDAIRL
mmetsp:Transcript_1844/g.4801  ORF Transcript_1844/g.4801 Transcript_1844/m.4801 type:complete len:214 (-) Transcript_1844:161-802(-)